MRLRPRYSLLTLLILTALVAGGVKWWRGPHTVILQNEGLGEVEYTYTRDLNGRQRRQGPLIMRFIDPAGNLEAITISYFRNDQHLKAEYHLRKLDDIPSAQSLLNHEEFSPASMTSEELEDFRRSIENERQKYKIIGPGIWWHEILFPRAKTL